MVLAPGLGEVLFLDTGDFSLYNQAFMLRRRIRYERGFLTTRNVLAEVKRSLRETPNSFAVRASRSLSANNGHEPTGVASFWSRNRGNFSCCGAPF